MKKQGSLLLLILTLLFCTFCLGFFVGRNYTQAPVQVSTLPSLTQTTEPPTQETQDASSPASEPTQTPAQSGALINVNTADQQTLMNLPGVGEVLSQRIIDYRESNGPFEDIGELLNVSGIGEKRLEDIMPLITVGG